MREPFLLFGVVATWHPLGGQVCNATWKAPRVGTTCTMGRLLEADQIGANPRLPQTARRRQRCSAAGLHRDAASPHRRHMVVTRKRKRRPPLSTLLPSDDDLLSPPSDASDPTPAHRRRRHAAARPLQRRHHSVAPPSNALLLSDRKANELRQWLRAALRRAAPRMLVLAGPPGCGKSSALRAVAAEQGCSVSSWDAAPPSSASTTQALLDDLRTFLAGARYAPLGAPPAASFGRARDAQQQPRILLLDDLPASPADAPHLRDALRAALHHAARFSPLPFVVEVSDGQRGVARFCRLVLGDELSRPPLAASVSVPAVTARMMARRLRETCAAACARASTDGVVEAAVASAAGDFRAALNGLRFSLDAPLAGEGGAARPFSRGVDGRGSVARKRLRRGNALATMAALGADGSLGTFHAVSKILNNKRDASGASMYDAEVLLEEARVESAHFLEFLHHNYPPFFSDADGIPPALAALSDADTLLPWRQEDDHRGMLQECAASVATRAFLQFNERPVRSGWRPIHGPQSYVLRKDAQEYALAARGALNAVTGTAVCTRADVCETLPLAERMLGMSLRPWGGVIGGGQDTGGVANAADVAMVDAENAPSGIGAWTGGTASGEGLFGMGGGNSTAFGRTLCKEEEEEPIEEWDD